MTCLSGFHEKGGAGAGEEGAGVVGHEAHQGLEAGLVLLQLREKIRMFAIVPFIRF